MPTKPNAARLPRDLHDQIGQVLTAVSADLQALEPTSDPAVHSERLETSLRLIDDTLRQVRDLSLDLRPALLDDLGLGPALEWYLNRQAQRSHLRVELVVEPPELRLPPALETTLFRLAQIALTNVVRHSQAAQVSVEVFQQDSRVDLVVRDDGVGFDVSDALDRAAHGGSLGALESARTGAPGRRRGRDPLGARPGRRDSGALPARLTGSGGLGGCDGRADHAAAHSSPVGR